MLITLACQGRRIYRCNINKTLTDQLPERAEKSQSGGQFLFKLTFHLCIEFRLKKRLCIAYSTWVSLRAHVSHCFIIECKGRWLMYWGNCCTDTVIVYETSTSLWKENPQTHRVSLHLGTKSQ